MVHASDVDIVAVRAVADDLSMAALDERIIGLTFAPVESDLERFIAGAGLQVIPFHANRINTAGVFPGHRGLHPILEKDRASPGGNRVHYFIVDDVPWLRGVGQRV